MYHEAMELRAKKSLGQHFLNSPRVLRAIVETAVIKTGESILEIGPGTGVLTNALLEAGGSVVAVEKDRRAIEGLSDRFSKEIGDRRLRLIEADILDRSSYTLDQANVPNKSYALVANIPYYITGAILELFLEHEPRPSRMVLLVQKEVAERITAKPTGNETIGKESIISISVKAFGSPRIIARVPRGAFKPPPTVDSAILSIEGISDARFKEKNLDISRFFTIVKAGFAHKRKVLRRNLEPVTAGKDLAKIWSDLMFDENVRAEDLAIEQWFGLASRLL